MLLTADNNISVKEYNKISKYKDLDIEIEKMWHFITTTMSVIIEALCMIKRGKDEHIKKISGSSILWETKKLHYVTVKYQLKEAEKT